MSKTNVFIYGSCVSRDTFEHFDPEQFELTQYVARQSALSAYTRPVELMAPPQVSSRFQQRMLTGDFQCSLQQLVPEAGPATDLVLVDLVDERLGAYVLPDGSVITRSTELIKSGAEQHLPEGSQHLPFGSEQHFQYWTGAIQAVGSMFRAAMPRAAVVLLDIPWAEWSETGEPAPDSFGITAQHANPIFAAYVREAADALQAQVISIDPNKVRSNPNHPWGEAPFHYSGPVYLDAVRQITGAPGRDVWAAKTSADHVPKIKSTGQEELTSSATATKSHHTARPLRGGPDFLIAGAQHAGTEWFSKQLAHHPDVLIGTGKGSNYFNRPARMRSQQETDLYLAALAQDPNARLRADCTPEYFWNGPGGPFGPKRSNTALHIKELVRDDVPVFVVLRSPVARAVEAYWRHFAAGRIDLAAGLFRASKQLGIIDQGFYARQLRQWSETLGSERLHILLYDDLLDDAKKALTRSLGILGVTPADDYWKSVDLHPSTRQKTWVRTFQKKNPLHAQEIAALVEIYRRDVASVERMLGRKLPQWLNRAGLLKTYSG